jgi:uncharacterized protein YlxW (UPF0749 family)
MDFSKETPRLIEPGVSYFLRKSLSKCNENKTLYFNRIFNLGLLFLFVLILGGMLMYKKNTKLTNKEKKAKQQKNREYILEKIKALNEKERQKRNEIITSLPKFESNFVQLHKNYYKI